MAHPSPATGYVPTLRKVAGEVALVATLTLLAAAVVAWPVPVDPAGQFIGPSANDHASIAWTLDFVARRLAAGELPWGHTARLEHPRGATLFPADLPEAVAVAPLVLLFGATAAFNVLTLAHHALVAGLTWGWLRREGADPAGSAAGAIALTLAPALVAGTFDGNPDVTPWYWLPAALWACRGPGWRRALLAGALVAVGGACSPYVGVMGAIAVALRVGVDRRWRDLVVVSSVALAGGLVVIGATSLALNADDAAIQKGHRVGLMGTASLAGLLRPWPYVVRTDAAWDVPRVATGTYLGVSLLGAAWLGRRRRAFAWSLVCIGVIAALGPELRLVEPPALPPGAGPPPPDGTGIALPWAAVELLPGLGQLQLTGRFTGLCALGLAWLVAHGAHRLGRWRWVVPAVVLADLGLVAGGARSLVARPAWDDGTCALLRDLPPGPVVDLPPTFHELWLYDSLCHGRPVAEGINRPLPRALRNELERAGPDAEVGVLAAAGYRWLVVHADPPAAGAPGLSIDRIARCEAARGPHAAIYDLTCAASAPDPGIGHEN